jgi:hypothetical protein
MFEELLLQALKGDNRPSYKSKGEAVDELKKFIDTAKPELKVGDFVERNEYGKNVYSMPKENQAAMVVRLIPEDEQTGGEDIAIMVAVYPGVLREFEADSRYYKASDAASGKNIFSFRKKL